ncbi:uncharacterized protein LOC124878172 [Girardinichthys multiradiatus]|uniref:uncharacterized protein LOC124878172 n=1 Tax=Girardinichthys multiradiatus TaxID=208333 RepID=UPI001FAD9B7B|nr:uncharacterized protein LOC124878172 [Girardinichthys multiradiatus]
MEFDLHLYVDNFYSFLKTTRNSLPKSVGIGDMRWRRKTDCYFSYGRTPRRSLCAAPFTRPTVETLQRSVKQVGQCLPVRPSTIRTDHKSLYLEKNLMLLAMASAEPQDIHGIVRQQHFISRLIVKLETALATTPLNTDFLEFACRQELYLWEALSRHVEVPAEIIQALQGFMGAVIEYNEYFQEVAISSTVVGEMGRRRFNIGEEILKERLDINLSVDCISKLLNVSSRTIQRRMNEFRLSVKQRYSQISDDELDEAIQQIKTEMPTAGYQMVKERLVSLGIIVHWQRLTASMHRVDSLGIFSRLTGLGEAYLLCQRTRVPVACGHKPQTYQIQHSHFWSC